MQDQDLIKALRSTREDYKEECTWHRFLLDAICGTGGFKGRVGPAPISILGWAAGAYAQRTTEQLLASDLSKDLTYLDQFPREDAAKFCDRIAVSYYCNYTGSIAETLLAYINKEEAGRQGIPASLKSWMEDVDGHGQGWDSMMRDVIKARALSLGWCPVLLDRSAVPPEYAGQEFSAARAKELGVGQVTMMPLYPINVLDWSASEDGELSAVKTCWMRTERDLLGGSVTREVYTLWYPDHLVRYVVEKNSSNGQDAIVDTAEIAYDYGEVPIKIVRAKPATEDKVRGSSVIGDVATANRRIFNLDSEHDDFLRNAAFALLAVPVADMDTSIGDLVGGNGSGLKVPMESKQFPAFIAPPATVPEAYKSRRDDVMREIYRAARLEFQKATGVTTSGVARAYEFEQTNRRLGEIAQSFARGEQECLRFAAKLLGASGDGITVQAPADFSVEDMAADLENITGLIGLGIPATAETELKRRAVARALPNLPPETEAAIEDEFEALQAQSVQDEAMAREVEQAAQKAQLENPGGQPEGEPGVPA